MVKNILFIFLLFLTSCNSGSYISDIQSQKTGLNFTEGKWLINEVDCPKEVYPKLYGSINKDFDNYLSGRLFISNQINTVLLPKKINFNPTKSELAAIKKGTLFDYFVNIKAEKIKGNLNNIDITNHKLNKGLLNRCSVIIEVYDLNMLEIIYSKKITGSVSIKENENSDINFSKNTSQIIMTCYKRIMKDIKKKSILK